MRERDRELDRGTEWERRCVFSCFAANSSLDVMPRYTTNSFGVLFIRTNFLACTFNRPLTIHHVLQLVFAIFVWVRRRCRHRRHIHTRLATKKYHPRCYLPLDNSLSLSLFSVIFVSFTSLQSNVVSQALNINASHSHHNWKHTKSNWHVNVVTRVMK